MDRFAVFRELVRSRRSIRRWLDEPVPRAHLELMLDCARMAPSDTNAQPWHFTVVTDRNLIRSLEHATLDRFAQLSAELQARGKRAVLRKLGIFAKYAGHFGTAPALILVSGEPYDSRFARDVFVEIMSEGELDTVRREESIKSTALASMNLLLAAHALGYGAVPMTGPVMAIPERLKRDLRVPDPYQPHLLIALGRPADEVVPAVPRKPLEEITTWIG